MTHFRQTIRAAIEARAKDVVDGAGDASDSRSIPIDQDDLPSSVVSFESEPASEPTRVDAERCKTRRTLSAVASFVSNSPSQIEEMAAEFERRMAAPLHPRVTHLLVETRFEDPARAESDNFSIALEYQVSYSLVDGSPEEAA